ncbi:flowering time control protein FPA isoform X2 [Lotus japonicus]|uniref:flowering time control protein FPA isoform X2 n=1 Tax=Lotus japonicus TaxID=34305 RepID=UPI00258BCC15|nr:flowering time control protein FPA isoform X2 [Lotus japonicus]
MSDKPPITSRDEDYSRDERRSALRGSSPVSNREHRGRHDSPEPHYSDKSKLSDKSSEPSEVLWVGFPAQLKVEESILRRAFSPFGEIEKITTFSGRSYAFVRFRSLTSACRARDNLRGKLFGNPRVHICFAKSDAGSSSSGRSSLNAPLSPLYKPRDRDGSSENLILDRSFGGDRNISSPNLYRNRDSGDSGSYDFNLRGGSSWTGGNNTNEQRNIGQKGTSLGAPHEFYGHINSPPRERNVHLGDFPQKFPQRGAFFEDQQAMPEDIPYLHEAKRLRTGPSSPEGELPEYPFSEFERQKHVFPRLLPDFPQREHFDQSFDSGNFAYRQTLDHRPNSPLAPLDNRHEGWKPYDSFPMGPGTLNSQSKFVEKKIFTPEPDNSSVSEWKWEGTIAKGGTPVCRARCFPVGKVLDILLPDFLDCTARTSLDMLAKHYYQAVGVWVVFFVPGSDADIEFYNEFMHYLEEKQRAAVAKLDDKTTVFLVPPSEFSEKVLKVPGKLSISGVILRLEYPTLNHGPMPIEGVMKNENLLSYNENAFNPNSSFPSVRIPPPSISEYGNSGISNHSFLGNKFPAAPSVSDSARALVSMPESHDDRSRSYPPLPPQTSGPNWSSHNLQNFRSLPMQLSSAASEPIAEERQPIIPRPDISSAHHSNAISGIPLSMPVGALEPEQLVRLAETLLEQRRQSGSSLSSSAFSDPRQNRFDGSDTSQRYAAENNLVNSEFSAPQLSQLLQSQMSNVALPPQTVQREPQSEVNGNQQFRDSGSLQATLQLASALLHQLQQGKPS